MARELPLRHRNLYHTLSRERFDSAVGDLHRKIPRLARHQIVLELARIVALVGDGHTNVAPTRDPEIGFRTYPVKLYFFRDGLFVRAADLAHKGLAGARVLRIGRAAPEEAYARVRELIGRDNEMGARYFAPFLLAMPEVLHGLGLIDDMERAPFLIERNGRRQTVVLRPRGPASMMPPDTDVSWAPERGWVDMRDAAAAPAPLWLREDPTVRYRFEYLPDTRTVYLQYNMVGHRADDSIPHFARRLQAFVDTAAVDRLVLDLRLNRGGDGTLNRPLLLSLIRARKLEGPGRLFVLIGRGTFSAAQFLVNDLERYTDALFVGEPTGGKANSYGDSRKTLLPNSGITVRASIYWWQEDPWDQRPWRAPDIAAELTSADYRANVDPAMKAVLAYRPEPPIDERMRRAFAAGDSALAMRRYREYRADPRHAYADTEAALNTLGYELLGQERYGPAVAVLALNAAEHPDSWNVHDSLGEAYLKAGRTEAAVASYERSVALNPGNVQGVETLKRLRE